MYTQPYGGRQFYYIEDYEAFSYETIPLAESNDVDEPTEVVKKIEHFIEDILIKLDDGQELEIFLIDLELNSVFNYDLGYYTLPEGLENVKYSRISLYNNSDKITKMLKIASIIHSKAIQKAHFSTKR
jgi:hypothetical protein